MAVNVGSTTDLNSEINVTPMVDVMLVLLIIFMVVTPLLQSGVTVNLPRGKSPDEDANIIKDTSVVVAIPAKEQYWVGGDFVAGKEKLIETIKDRMGKLKADDPKVVYIKGSVGVEYGEIVKVIDAIREAKIDQIGLVAEKKKAGEP